MNFFNPFDTTKEEGEGTGLGLAMVFGAIRSCEAWVDVEITSQQQILYLLRHMTAVGSYPRDLASEYVLLEKPFAIPLLSMAIREKLD